MGGVEEGMSLPISQNVGKFRLTKIFVTSHNCPPLLTLEFPSPIFQFPYLFADIMLPCDFVNKFGVEQGDDTLLESNDEFSERGSWI